MANYTYTCFHAHQAISIRIMSNGWLHKGAIVCPPCKELCGVSIINIILSYMPLILLKQALVWFRSNDNGANSTIYICLNWKQSKPYGLSTLATDPWGGSCIDIFLGVCCRRRYINKYNKFCANKPLLCCC